MIYALDENLTMLKNYLREVKIENERIQYALKNVNEALERHMVVQNIVLLTLTEDIHSNFVR